MRKEKIYGLTIILFIILTAFSCKTKPEVPEATTTTSTVATTTTTTTTVLATTTTTTIDRMAETISDKEFADAQSLIDKARMAEADRYDRENLIKAEEFLRTAYQKNGTDGKATKEALEQSKKYSDLAYKNAFKKRAELKRAECDKLFSEADALGIKNLMKDNIDQSRAIYNEGNQKYSSEDYVAAYSKYSDCESSLKSAVNKMKATRSEYDNKIGYINKLIDEAKKIGAETYAPADLESAIENLNKGKAELSNFDYTNSQTSLEVAEKSAISAIDKTKFAIKEKKRKEALRAIMEAGATVEEASQTNIGEYEKSDGGYNFEFDGEIKDMNNSPDDMSSSISYRDLLNKAIEYIDKAKQAYRAEDYDMAIQYANIAKRIALSYKEGGNKTKYTVRLLPDKRDCLWRISEYSFIYGSPFLWPRIWKANKEQILNPDLIYPGQVLLIPNVD
ncbi:MAG TPA: LysM peptidoglycan-binding domain-containing protein [Spirochaetota bacterium]|jgi:nucleoid-associated protein YgaU|nr:MAG: LysM domain/BON superfamily protein [Spirochaetes bacterium ADurb.Bin133]HNZ25964.1 LysM peptidoglycan-binding domain-containing protein [Spirochaetota bacterium]HPY86511.1 LysM peptidoglycan-binding domain-containing protein [Spirochaetota bacterium]